MKLRNFLCLLPIMGLQFCKTAPTPASSILGRDRWKLQFSFAFSSSTETSKLGKKTTVNYPKSGKDLQVSNDKLGHDAKLSSDFMYYNSALAAAKRLLNTPFNGDVMTDLKITFGKVDCSQKKEGGLKSFLKALKKVGHLVFVIWSPDYMKVEDIEDEAFCFDEIKMDDVVLSTDFASDVFCGSSELNELNCTLRGVVKKPTIIGVYIFKSSGPIDMDSRCNVIGDVGISDQRKC